MNITDQSKASNVLGGKTARACDSCLLKRARWFCAADDAFLCQACDATVHSANPLASRHERVRLETSSCKISDSNPSPPAWHQGFTRKARTPRQVKGGPRAPPPANHQLPLVPEMNCEDPFPEESDEQHFCRVPVFDAFGDEFCMVKEGDVLFDLNQDDGDLNLDVLLGNCDEELAEFAADVEGLLGNNGAEDKNLGLGATDCQEGLIHEFSDGKRVKIEEKEDEEDDDDEEVKVVIACNFDPSLEMELNWDFNYASSSMNGECGEEMKGGPTVKTTSKIDVGMDDSEDKKRMSLRLNYEAVIAAWASQGSPWTDGIRPQFNLDEFMVACLGGSSYHQCGGGGGRFSGRSNAGREARVSRYREKRRTRLFSKKIRYEVRKLNAEKRPRMKGRFVKRTQFSGSSLPYQLMNK